MRRREAWSIFGPMKARLFTIISIVVCQSSILAADWPQWLGPNRDAVWPESGIVEKFPEGGLEEVWRKPIGLGYAGPTVVGGKVFVAKCRVAALEP